MNTDTLPKDWKPEDAAHAKRVLKAVVEQGKDRIWNWEHGAGLKAWENQQVRATLIMLVEGAEMVIRIWDRSNLGMRYAKSGIDKPVVIAMAEGGLMVADLVVEQTAKAYAPRMAEAGMKVPE